MSLRNRLTEWGFDGDGDLLLRVGFVCFTLYKYQHPIVTFNTRDFTPATPDQIRAVWATYRRPSAEKEGK